MTRYVALLVALVACGGHDTGSEGPPGPAGPQGPAGPAGPPGMVTVLDGGVLQGPPGPQGPAGPEGPAGAAGAAGATGAMGPQGLPGSTGPAGAAGPAGAQGAQGVAGAQGPAGSQFGEAAAVFAGFSTTPITGAPGSREQMHARCAAAFAGSHLCHEAEYLLASSATTPPATGAWIDRSGTVALDGDDSVVAGVASIDVGRYQGTLDQGNCDNWTATTSSGNVLAGETITPGGVVEALCSQTHVLACCSTPYAEKFRGFTAALSTGAPGSRAQMHARCGAQFPGSHLCHAAEYYRTQSATTVPAGGAWIDASGFVQATATVQVTTTVSPVHAGRYGDPLDQGNCDGWTATTSNGNTLAGDTVTAAGTVEVLCSSSHPLACCQ